MLLRFPISIQISLSTPLEFVNVYVDKLQRGAYTRSMMTLFKKEIYQDAYRQWWRRCFHWKEKDLQLKPFLSPEIKAFSQGDSWLREAREASLTSAETVANKLGVTRAAYCALEAREKTGSLTIKSLAEAAEALDCELIYAIRPKKKVRFSELLWLKLVPHAEKHPWVKSRPERYQANAMTRFAVQYFEDPAFRKKQGWTGKRSPSPLRTIKLDRKPPGE